MKRIIFCLCLIQLALPLQAKSVDSEPNRLETLVTILQVSESQSAEFISIMKAQNEQRKRVHDQHEESRKEKRQAMNTLKDETLEKLSDVLSDSQIEAFQALMAQKKQHKRGAKSHCKSGKSNHK